MPSSIILIAMLKGTEKEKLKGVYAETCEFQVSNDTYKTYLSDVPVPRN